MFPAIVGTQDPMGVLFPLTIPFFRGFAILLGFAQLLQFVRTINHRQQLE